MKTITHKKHKETIKRQIRRKLIDAALASIDNGNPNDKLLKYLYNGIFDHITE